MDIKRLITLCITSIIFINLPSIAFAQKTFEKGNFVVHYEPKSESAIAVYTVVNNSDDDLTFIFRITGQNKVEIPIAKHTTHNFEDNFECKRIAYKKPKGDGVETIWSDTQTTDAWRTYQRTNQPATEEEPEKKEVQKVAKETKKPERNETKTQTTNKKKSQPKEIDSKQIVCEFVNFLNNDSFYSLQNIENLEKSINDHINNIDGYQDKHNYIKEKNLRDFIEAESSKIYEHSQNVDNFTTNYLSKYEGYKIKSTFNHQDSIKSILSQRIERRKTNIFSLNDKINEVSNKGFSIAQMDKTTLLIIGGIALIIVVLGVSIIIIGRRKKSPTYTVTDGVKPQVSNEVSSAIVIRKTTTTILKKQNLDNVVNNQTYFKIEATDFCDDSAVKHIFIKNTCIKDIYNMYADDLRNPNNPKEDGCMVVGRWVLDEATNKYNVSLEEIVRPGDDAVFKEYELNFGGKIKLRVAERLRKLRNETNLQYDLTCWVHSHPGLGVFFSNFDSSVQTQLKHSTHPNFLIAIVVDILTPQQEFGIFTFKSDSSINSRNDIRKMYSLEELHRWAVKSDRNSYKTEDCYNILAKAKQLSSNCQGIQLSNSAIIDITSLTTEPNSGLIGWVHGFKTECKDKSEYVVNSISKEEKVVDNELLGCLVAGTLRSIPSIKKAVGESINRIKFVMFYSEKEGVLTTIPVINKQLAMEEEFYSEETLEDLKIWTRRKR